MTKEEKIAVFLFAGAKISHIQQALKTSPEEIEKIKKETDLTVCPVCGGMPYKKGEKCLCERLRINRKYLKPLNPDQYEVDLIPPKGLPDNSKNLHRIISGNLNLRQINTYFMWLLMNEVNKQRRRTVEGTRDPYTNLYTRYEYLSITDLRDISYGDHEDYKNINTIKSPIILINALIGATKTDNYLNLLDSILEELLIVREIKRKPVWVCIPERGFPLTDNYNNRENINPTIISNQQLPSKYIK